ncbi:ATP-dependent DNA helicase PIF1-like [Aphis craccivora]|uniref:ATP-dependent DNA helicase n=1 Tax=Aphis craccivora TaxID=307492 RepID=A0A6G0Y7Q5_APHCR|nr:ATP-dependent DNA helicase PIF1-like [Aphis craccivora]
MKQIFHQYQEVPFGNKIMIFCGDLSQLPPVRQITIYKRTSLNFTADSIWQTLDYYRLEEVMRQSNIMFSFVLTKIGNGDKLTDDECEYLEHRFVNRASVDQTNSATIRLFHTNEEIDEYHASIFDGLKHETISMLVRKLEINSYRHVRRCTG